MTTWSTSAAALRRRGAFDHVVAAFLELAEPSIPQGGQQCVAAGATRVVLTPYFLSAGVHVREDLQRFQGELGAAHPAVEFCSPSRSDAIRSCSKSCSRASARRLPAGGTRAGNTRERLRVGLRLGR